MPATYRSAETRENVRAGHARDQMMGLCQCRLGRC